MRAKRERILREQALGLPVEIPQSLIDKLKPYHAHFIKIAKPVPGDVKSGKNAVEHGWPDRPYEANDPDLLLWLFTGGNYGATARWPIGMIDADTKELQALIEAKINTYTVRSGRTIGEGRHYYIITNATENGVVYDKNGKNIGNIQIQNKYVVGPGCRHNSGGVYRVINDMPFAEISKEQLDELFDEQVKWTRQLLKTDEQEAENEKKRAGMEIPLGTFFDLDKFKKHGDEYQGSHPIHGSMTGTNLNVNLKENVWHCFRCNSGGGGLMWIAVKHGLLQCHEAQKGALTGVRFLEAIECARKEGFDIRLPEEEISEDVRRFFKNKKFIPRRLANFLMEKSRYATREADKTIFRYNPEVGIYQEVSDILIEQKITNILGDHYSGNRARETIGFLKANNVQPMANLPTELIAVKNGILNIFTREITAFTPDLFIINALPVEYKKDADCPKFKTFLSQVVPEEEDRKGLQEFCGYILLPSCKYDKALMLIGNGANGKGTMLKVWKAMYGNPNVSSEELQELTINRFRLAELFGKMANIHTDLSNLAVKEDRLFKQLVSGDPLSAEKKGRDPFEFSNLAKLCFSTNSPPKPPEKESEKNAYFRRWVMVTFPNEFPDNDPKTNPNLLEELTISEELAGILNLALDGLDRLRAQKHFTNSKTSDVTRQLYELLSNPEKAFMNERVACEIAGKLNKTELYADYRKYCLLHKLPIISKWAFSQKVIEYLQPSSIRDNGGTWVGIRMKTDDEIKDSEKE